MSFFLRITTVICLGLLALPSSTAPYRAFGAEDVFPVDLFSLEIKNDEDPWCVGVYASHYGDGEGKKYYGGFGSRIYPSKDLFVALPAQKDSLDCLDGKMASRIDEDTGVFRVIEIKAHDADSPVLEATVEDIGPWYCGDDPYWETGARPASEDGIDDKGRHTNMAGIDISYRLAKELGINGIGQVDWRFKKVDGEYVTIEKQAEFRKKMSR